MLETEVFHSKWSLYPGYVHVATSHLTVPTNAYIHVHVQMYMYVHVHDFVHVYIFTYKFSQDSLSPPINFSLWHAIYCGRDQDHQTA